jgi:malonate decarboxylase beta subunit
MRQDVFGAAQEGGFMGGAVGEVHGAKLVGLLRRAVDEQACAVLLLLESGGVRLHEANAGLIAVSEVMRAILDARAAGIPVVALIGGSNGCFGGMGIVARCANAIVMSEEGRLGMSGPEVIETTHGVEEFDFARPGPGLAHHGRQAPLPAGRLPDALVADDMAAFRRPRCGMMPLVTRHGSALTLPKTWKPSSTCWSGACRILATMPSRCRSGRTWALPTRPVPMLEADAFVRLAEGHRRRKR